MFTKVEEMMKNFIIFFPFNLHVTSFNLECLLSPCHILHYLSFIPSSSTSLTSFSYRRPPPLSPPPPRPPSPHFYSPPTPPPHPTPPPPHPNPPPTPLTPPPSSSSSASLCHLSFPFCLPP